MFFHIVLAIIFNVLFHVLVLLTILIREAFTERIILILILFQFRSLHLGTTILRAEWNLSGFPQLALRHIRIMFAAIGFIIADVGIGLAVFVDDLFFGVKVCTRGQQNFFNGGG
jgi:hypothetical protein